MTSDHQANSVQHHYGASPGHAHAPWLCSRQLVSDCVACRLAGVAGVATTGDDNLADASLRDVRPPHKTLSQVRHPPAMRRALADRKAGWRGADASLHRCWLKA